MEKSLDFYYSIAIHIKWLFCDSCIDGSSFLKSQGSVSALPLILFHKPHEMILQTQDCEPNYTVSPALLCYLNRLFDGHFFTSVYKYYQSIWETLCFALKNLPSAALTSSE